MHFSVCIATSVECVYVDCLFHLTHVSSSALLLTAGEACSQQRMWLRTGSDRSGVWTIFMYVSQKSLLDMDVAICASYHHRSTYMHTHIQHFFTIATDSCALIWIFKENHSWVIFAFA